MPSIALPHALMYRTKRVGEERECVCLYECVWVGGGVSETQKGLKTKKTAMGN